MSFLSVLKTIGHAVEVGVGAASPFSGLISMIPGVGPEAVMVIKIVGLAEEAFTASGTGAQKKDFALKTLALVLPKFDQASASTAIDDFVAGVNQVTAALAKMQSK